MAVARRMDVERYLTELTKGIPAKGGQTVRLVSGESAEGEVVR